jgi:hypothetical protein
VGIELKMEEEMEEFVMEPFVCEETDLNYEFDAARFYDFTRPETDWEAIEAECWFESAQPNPPSRKHFLVCLIKYLSADYIVLIGLLCVNWIVD